MTISWYCSKCSKPLDDINTICPCTGWRVPRYGYTDIAEGGPVKLKADTGSFTLSVLQSEIMALRAENDNLRQAMAHDSRRYALLRERLDAVSAVLKNIGY